jgi:hypothetical protein
VERERTEVTDCKGRVGGKGMREKGITNCKGRRLQIAVKVISIGRGRSFLKGVGPRSTPGTWINLIVKEGV